MSRAKSPKTLRAMELMKDRRLTNKQIALRCGMDSSYVGYLRRKMEAEQCK